MKHQKIREIKTLIARLVMVVILAVVGYCVYVLFFSNKTNSDEVVLADTPLRVEQIRSILELNTLKFQDEVVVDSVEFYQSTSEQIAGNLGKLADANQFKNGLRGSMIKRRLTMIVKGELIYGVDLKRKDFTMQSIYDSLIITIPTPELLSIQINPNGTDIYTENGFWKDYERTVLQRKAREKMIQTGETLKLSERAKKPLEKLMRSLVQTKQHVVIRFEK